MKKILYVDVDAPIGHVNFNRIWLSVLSKYPIELTTCLPKAYYAKISVPTNNISVPAFLCRGKGPVFWRIFSVLRLIWLVLFVDIRKYDAILFSSFENTTFAFILYLFLFDNVFCVCHNNLEKARNNSRHKSFLSFIAKRVTLIALNNAMKSYLDSELCAIKTICIRHGFPASIHSSITKKNHSFDYMFRGKKIVFIPSLTSSSDSELIQIQKDVRLLDVLNRINGQIVISKKISIVNTALFYSFPNRLTDEEYFYIFQRAEAILLLYPDTFFRLSAILHEAIINNKIVLLPDIKIFEDYKKIIPEFLFYKSFDHIAEILFHLSDYQHIRYQIPDYMRIPDFTDFLDSVS